MRSLAVLIGIGCVAAAVPARAHIRMTAPPDWLVPNSEGDPQKVSPCGVDPTAVPGPTTYTPSNTVTTVHPGDKLTVSWVETVPHDGHFRIALALHSRDELTDPTVTGTNADGTPSAVTISTAYPVLADNLFPHQAASVSSGKTYSTTVTIPNATCTKCTLQLIQFMSEHPADPTFFYHHCADLSIIGPVDAGATHDAAATHDASHTTHDAGGSVRDAGVVHDAGTAHDAAATGHDAGATTHGRDAATDVAGGTGPGSSAGCGCHTVPGGAPAGAVTLLALALVAARRRRR